MLIALHLESVYLKQANRSLSEIFQTEECFGVHSFVAPPESFVSEVTPPKVRSS